jgi:hypothetical protein
MSNHPQSPEKRGAKMALARKHFVFLAAKTAGPDSPRAWEVYHLLGEVARNSSVIGLSFLINHPADERRFVTIEESRP